MTRAPGNVTQNTIEVLFRDGATAIITTPGDPQATILFDALMAPGVAGTVAWAVLKAPGETRYRVRASYGREPAADVIAAARATAGGQEDPRVTAARAAATGGPRSDVTLPASVLVTMYYDLQRALRGLLAAHDEGARQT